MRKTYWMLTVFIFITGIMLGAVGYSYFGTKLLPTQFVIPGSLSQGTDQTTLNNTSGQKNGETAVSLPQNDQEKIISDYKQALGTLFEAWKSKDPAAFRKIIEAAYRGQIMENHIAKAEKFLAQGVGLEVSKINFDKIEIESADNYSATLNAAYHYSVRNYNLKEAIPYGEEQEHTAHVRANLVKINSHWIITGETAI